MDELEKPSASEIIRSPFVWPIPGALLSIPALFSPSMWKTVDRFTRYGRDIKVIPAVEFLLIVGALLVIYYISFLPVIREMMGMGHTMSGMRPASDAEKGCAVAIIRYASLLAFYALILTHL